MRYIKNHSFLLAFLGAVLISFNVNATTTIELEGDYEAHTAERKQKYLWAKVKNSGYKDGPPDLKKFGAKELWSMFKQGFAEKVWYFSKGAPKSSDEAPEGWVKYIHRHGAMAKVKFVPNELSPYTGIFKGFDYGLLRLSLTYGPGEKKAVAPGLALKVLRDGVPSANVSALYTLEGQGRNFNFFANPLSNIVPASGLMSTAKFVHWAFKKSTKYPEEIKIEHLALHDSKGNKENEIVSPRQIFFIPNIPNEKIKISTKPYKKIEASEEPNEKIEISTKPHDVRKDFLKIPEGTLLYKVYAMPDEERFKKFNYFKNYEVDMIKAFAKKAEANYLGSIITTSPFIVSEFGDDGILFRHQVAPKKRAGRRKY